MKSNLKLTVVYYVLNVDGLCCFELLGLCMLIVTFITCDLIVILSYNLLCCCNTRDIYWAYI